MVVTEVDWDPLVDWEAPVVDWEGPVVVVVVVVAPADSTNLRQRRHGPKHKQVN